MRQPRSPLGCPSRTYRRPSVTYAHRYHPSITCPHQYRPSISPRPGGLSVPPPALLPHAPGPRPPLPLAHASRPRTGGLSRSPAPGTAPRSHQHLPADARTTPGSDSGGSPVPPPPAAAAGPVAARPAGGEVLQVPHRLPGCVPLGSSRALGGSGQEHQIRCCWQ